MFLTRIIACGFVLSVVGACGTSVTNSGAGAGSNAMSDRTGAPAGMPQASVEGSATYRERIATPPGAVFEAVLEDVSRADAPAQVIGRTRIEPAGQPPFRFRIGYDPARLQARNTYALRARVSLGDQLLFATDRHYPLPPPGQQVELMLVRAQSSQASSASATATLENTYWKLVELGGKPVTPAAEREPYVVLHSEGRRIAGFGGCNRLIGGYSLSGQKLSFSQMAGTMMACPDDDEQYERAFHQALGKAASWRIDGERLELFDEAGVSVARFESRYMR